MFRMNRHPGYTWTTAAAAFRNSPYSSRNIRENSTLSIFKHKVSVVQPPNYFGNGQLRQKLGAASRKLSTYFHVSEKVQNAVAENVPVVALESAIITHGMPWPTNIETALGIQSIIKRKGVVPATVGVIEGKVKVGLSDEEIEFLGSRAAGAPGRNENKDLPLVKVSRRDFPLVISQGLSGGTTVAGTIIAASKANIPIFATGGIGGVHRGAEVTFDISCDLRELGRSPIAVVSAGVKSILDIGKTLEYLETEGVCVCVMKRQSPPDAGELGIRNKWKRTVKFPSFFTAESQFSSPLAIEDEMQAAGLVHSALQFGLGSGILIALPIPKELEASGDEIEIAIEGALKKAAQLGIQGKEMTPFLLSEINEVTRGHSLRANQRLIENNVTIASVIAIELAKLREKNVGNDDRFSSPPFSGTNKRVGTVHLSGPIVPKNTSSDPLGSCNTREQKNTSSCLSGINSTTSNLSRQDEKELMISAKINQPGIFARSGSSPDFSFQLGPGHRPVVIGGSCLDIMLAVEEDQLVEDGRTHKGKIQTVSGGVGRNMAEALAKLGQDPFLITAIGEDAFGRALLEHFQACNMDTGGITRSKNPTPIYSAILNPKRECLFGVGDMSLHAQISANLVAKHVQEIQSASIVLIDGNLPVETIEMTMRLCTKHKIPLWFEPTEVRKASKILQVPMEFWSSLTFVSPNLKELESLTTFSISTSSAATTTTAGESTEKVGCRQSGESQVSQDDIKRILSASFAQFTGLGLLLLTCGKEGFTVAHHGKGQRSTDDLTLLHFPSPALPPEEIKSVSGAGDCLNAGFISGLLEGLTLEECGVKASVCAGDSLKSTYNVPPVFSLGSR